LNLKTEEHVFLFDIKVIGPPPNLKFQVCWAVSV
jgi:hypothetical protein